MGFSKSFKKAAGDIAKGAITVSMAPLAPALVGVKAAMGGLGGALGSVGVGGSARGSLGGLGGGFGGRDLSSAFNQRLARLDDDRLSRIGNSPSSLQYLNVGKRRA